LLQTIASRIGRRMRADVLSLGFARRVTAYKRTDLLLSDIDRLRAIASQHPLQIIFAGKAHPRDAPGKELIRRVFAASRALGEDVPCVFVEYYNLELARELVAGCDVWINTPEPPMEASGTSGMKAAHNGAPSLSTLDGWWLEGHVDGITGWSVGARDAGATDSKRDAAELLQRLAEIAPKFYGDRDAWVDVMRHTIALNASFFNTHRMVQQYSLSAYL
jgi:starch phosphorylase